MFANRLSYTQSPGGIRRGLIWQSSNIKKSEYKWVDRYTIGSTTIDGEDYTLAMGYTLQSVLASDNFQIPIDTLTPIRVKGVSPKPDREYEYGDRDDYYVYDYLIYTIYDHQKLSTTFGSIYPQITEELYRSAVHQYMRNTEAGMNRTTDTNKSLIRNLIKPVYSIYWIKRQRTTEITDNEYLPDGTYNTDQFFTRGQFAFPGQSTDTDFWREWQTKSELERRYLACPDLFKYVLTDNTTKIKVPRKAIVTTRNISFDNYQPYVGNTRNPNFVMSQETMISPYDGDPHTYQPRWNNRALWQQTYSADAQDYVDDYYIINPGSEGTQSITESRIYVTGGRTYARLKPIIPQRSSGSHITAFAPIWYGPVIGFGSYYNILNVMGMTDFYLDNAYTEYGNGRLCMILNGYECESASLNEIVMS